VAQRRARELGSVELGAFEVHAPEVGTFEESAREVDPLVSCDRERLPEIVARMSRESRARALRAGRPAREAASASALAPALLRYVASRGVDAVLLADRAVLELADAEREDVAVTSASLATMLGLAASLLGEPHLGLRLPLELPFRRYDAALAARVAASPRDVLRAIARLAPLVFPRLEANVVEEADEAQLCTRIGSTPRGLGVHVDEYVLAFALVHCLRGGAVVFPRRGRDRLGHEDELADPPASPRRRGRAFLRPPR
jgi:hypothetical protein